jgi:hypothetical protein
MVSVNEQMGQEKVESSGNLFDKVIELPKETSAEKYREFYDEWMRLHQNHNTSGKLYPSRWRSGYSTAQTRQMKRTDKRKSHRTKGVRYET